MQEIYSTANTQIKCHLSGIPGQKFQMQLLTPFWVFSCYPVKNYKKGVLDCILVTTLLHIFFRKKCKLLQDKHLP